MNLLVMLRSLFTTTGVFEYLITSTLVQKKKKLSFKTPLVLHVRVTHLTQFLFEILTGKTSCKGKKDDM